MFRVFQSRRGATSIEYGLFAVIVALILSSGISTLGETVTAGFENAGAAMATPPGDQPKKNTWESFEQTSQGAKYVEFDEDMNPNDKTQ